MMKTLRLIITFLLIFTSSFPQSKVVSRNSNLSAGYLQIKESANFGLVFNGPVIYYGMTWNNLNDKRLIKYEYNMGLGILFSQEIPALGFYLKPVDLAYMFNFSLVDNNLFIGPALTYVYNYNLYPDLQSGFDYWLTNLGLGVECHYSFYISNALFSVKLNTSVVGFTSRQEEYRDPYFYDLGFKYAIKHLNRKMTFGTFNSFNNSNLEILWKFNTTSKLTIGYELRYSGYYEAPEIDIVSHNIKVIIKK